jgi:hypothetical protein
VGFSRIRARTSIQQIAPSPNSLLGARNAGHGSRSTAAGPKDPRPEADYYGTCYSVGGASFLKLTQMIDKGVSGTFSGQLAGRSGFITYREADRELKIYWELSGSSKHQVLISPDFRSWLNMPEGHMSHISEETQLELLFALRGWLSSQNIRSDIDSPSDLSKQEARCIWAGCDSPRLKGYYYCRHHFDLSCLTR